MVAAAGADAVLVDEAVPALVGVAVPVRRAPRGAVPPGGQLRHARANAEGLICADGI